MKKKQTKWIPPEKRMKRYQDFGIDEYGNGDVSKIKFTQFKIVVPTEKDKEELQAAFEYLHDRDIDTEFVTVNQLAHEYDQWTKEKFTRIIVDEDLYRRIEMATCPHITTYVQDGIKYCQDCWKALEVTSFRD